MKKLLPILLVLVMMLSIVPGVLADGLTGSITIINATPGTNYKAYKIFDVSWGESDVSTYTIGTSDPWYNLVSGDDSPFSLDPIQDEDDLRVVSVAEKTEGTPYTDQEIVAWFMGVVLPAESNPAEATANSTTLVFEGLSYGYYLVTPILNGGAVVTLNNVNGDVSIIDKNQKPGWYDPSPDDPRSHDGKNLELHGDESTDDYYGGQTSELLGGIADFVITANVPKYNGGKEVDKYTFVDTLPPGIDFEEQFHLSEAKLLYGDGRLYLNFNPDNDESEPPDGFTIDVDHQLRKLTITFKVKDYDSKAYPADAKLFYSYQTDVNTDAKHENINTVTMSWTEFDALKPIGDDNPPVKAPDVDLPIPAQATVYVYGFSLQKYKNYIKADNKLEGAYFRLSYLDELNQVDYVDDDGTHHTSYPGRIPVVRDNNGHYRVSPDHFEDNKGSPGDSDDIVAGSAQIFGLEAGTYYLFEIVAPEGFNPLAGPIQVVIPELFPDDQDYGETYHDEGYLKAEVAVVNLTGAVLPETGGRGTTLIYILGGLLVLGTVVVLVTRKRMAKGG